MVRFKRRKTLFLLLPDIDLPKWHLWQRGRVVRASGFCAMNIVDMADRIHPSRNLLEQGTQVTLLTGGFSPRASERFAEVSSCEFI